MELKVDNVSKSFGHIHVLQSISIGLSEPGITAILGPNGSGKTTLMKSILGLVIPDKGDIQFNGKSIRNRWDYRNTINYLPQIARFPDHLSIEELIQLIQDLREGPFRTEELSQLFEIDSIYDQKLRNLSGGTRQKVNIIVALMSDNPYLLLDEPSSGLDPLANITLKKFLKKEKANGKKIIVTTHIIDFVEEMADNIIFLLNGKVHFNGTVKALKKQYKADKLEQTIANILEFNNSHA